jgi:hypothetical protein
MQVQENVLSLLNTGALPLLTHVLFIYIIYELPEVSSFYRLL